MIKFMTQVKHRYIRLLRLDKLTGFWLLLWPTLWSLFYPTHATPSGYVVIVFTVGTLMMRTAGCLINDWLDRDIDCHVARTASRPLASKECSGRECLTALFICLAASACCALLLGYKVVLMSLPALFMVMLYPLAKRYFILPQLFLALVFSLGVLFGFQVTEGQIASHAWFLYSATAFWVFAFDGIYAFNDVEDDKRIGINSAVIVLGSWSGPVLMTCYLIFYVSWLVLIYPYISISLFIMMFVLIFATGAIITAYFKRGSHWGGFVINAWFGAILCMLLLLRLL